MLAKSEINRIQAELMSYDKAREKLQVLTRNATRLCGWGIIQVHRSNLTEADKTLNEAKQNLDELQGLLSKHSELPQFGQALVAFQEYAEAKLVYQMKKNGKLATQSEVGVNSTAYLLGILDFIGEMRRMTLDELRRETLTKPNSSYPQWRKFTKTSCP